MWFTVPMTNLNNDAFDRLYRHVNIHDEETTRLFFRKNDNALALVAAFYAQLAYLAVNH
jgi:hypothetical protein